MILKANYERRVPKDNYFLFMKRRFPIRHRYDIILLRFHGSEAVGFVLPVDELPQPIPESVEGW
ncbi:MAG: hypothetical protein D6732_17915 [Methanobacteriota archaeon]|nr:MAG: hypothetical protein D6732_17915 [Euryarchaeota archaeon]